MPGSECPICHTVNYAQSDLKAHLWTSHHAMTELVDAIVGLVEELDEAESRYAELEAEAE